MATLTDDQILQKVRSVLIDALGADEEEVTPESKIVADLGAESIDFLDIRFRLEKEFRLVNVEVFTLHDRLEKEVLTADGSKGRLRSQPGVRRNGH